MNFYVSVFENSKIKNIAYYGEAGAEVSGRGKGSVMTIAFQLEGQQFMALNGGSQFTFSPAISFLVNCRTQQEIDYLWEKLSEDGKEEQCGWLKDRYGVSWQIVPAMLGEMMLDKDEERTERVMKAMLPMKKLDTVALKEAYDDVLSEVLV